MERRKFLKFAISGALAALAPLGGKKKEKLTFEHVQEAVKSSVKAPWAVEEKEYQDLNELMASEARDLIHEGSAMTATHVGNFDGFLKQHYSKVVSGAIDERFILENIHA